MTNEQNIALVAKLREAEAAGDELAARRIREAIVKGNEGLVLKLAKRFGRPATEDDLKDSMQAARMGILRALQDFDPAKGAFSTHAGSHMRDYVQRWSGKTVAVARPRSANMPASIAEMARRHRMKFGTEPTAQELGVTEQQLIEWSTGTHFVSLADEGDEETPRFELTACNDEGEHEAQCEELQVAWKAAVEDLSPRNREIADRVLMKGETTVDVAASLDLAHSRVTQICKRIETRLRRALNPATYDPKQDRDRKRAEKERLRYAAAKTPSYAAKRGACPYFKVPPQTKTESLTNALGTLVHAYVEKRMAS